jgi:hypothetical protein
MAIGLGIWVAAMRARRAQFYRARAEGLTRAEQDHRNQAARYYNRVIVDEVRIELDRERARDEFDRHSVRQSLETLERQREMVRLEDLRADYCRALAVKYQHAAGQPWESVEPDPPQP